MDKSNKPEWAKSLTLTVSANMLEAELTFRYRNGVLRPTFEQIKLYLNTSGIVFGIINEAVLRLASGSVADGGVLTEIVAKGQTPEDAVFDKIEYLVSLPVGMKPKILEDGSVDLRDLGRVTNVNEGDPLIRRIPGKKGKAGHNVRGEVIPAAQYRPFAIPVGLNTAISASDPDLLVAACAGSIVRFGNFYNVYKEYEVSGDIDYSTGNLELAGSAKITGSVRPGFTVRVSGNLTIEGDVEEATIECGGKLVVKGGVIGRGKTVVYSACGIEVRYVNGHKLKTPGSIIIHEECIGATIQSGEDIIIGGRGVMAGGEAYVFRQMNVRVLGAESGVYTDVYFGFDTVLGGRQAEIRASIDDIAAKMVVKRGAMYEAFKKAFASKVTADLNEAEELRNGLLDDFEKLDLLEQEDGAINEQRLKDNEPSVHVRDAVYPGVKIASPVTQYFVKDKRSGQGVYSVSNGEIVFRRS